MMSLSQRVARRFLSGKGSPAFKGKKKTDKGNTIYLYDEKHVEKRTRKKVNQVNKLQGVIGDVRKTYRKDMRSKDIETKLTALSVALMDHTFERIGNPGSAKEGHFGVTNWRKKHIKFKQNGTASLSYVGKSGVKHTKAVTDKVLVKVLKGLCQGKDKEGCILSEGDLGARPSKVNAYLKPFGITAKDLRGFHANRLMKQKLRELKRELPQTKDLKAKTQNRKNKFKEALNWVANEVGHEASTLRSQYLSPNLEIDFVESGRVNERAQMKKKKTASEIASRVAHRHLAKLTHNNVRTAGEIVHRKDSGPVRRALPTHFNFNEKALEPLAKTVWHLSIGMGHLLSAQGTFNRIKASSISPDGMIGGRGYIQVVAEMRQSLSQALEIVSATVDTIHDEITAAHWNPEMLQLPEDEQQDVEDILAEAEDILAAPKDKAEEEYKEDMDDKVEDKENKAKDERDADKEEEGKSGLPTDNGEEGEAESNEYETPDEMREASVKEPRGRPNSWEDDGGVEQGLNSRPKLNEPPEYEWGLGTGTPMTGYASAAVRKAMKNR